MGGGAVLPEALGGSKGRGTRVQKVPFARNSANSALDASLSSRCCSLVVTSVPYHGLNRLMCTMGLYTRFNGSNSPTIRRDSTKSTTHTTMHPFPSSVFRSIDA